MRLQWSPFLAILAVPLLFSVILAADFWEKKPYTEWSEKECTKLLTRSPWAYSNSFRRNANIGSSRTGERETTEIIYFRLLTAKPIRMALAQLQLLQRPEDEMLRNQIDEYVNAPSGDQVVIQMSYKSIPGASVYLQYLHSFFGRATRADFHGNTVLMSSAKVTVPLADFLPWTESRPNPAFVFPRTDKSGEPLFTARVDSLTLRSEFELQSPDYRRGYRIHVKMKSKKMVFQGELTF